MTDADGKTFFGFDIDESCAGLKIGRDIYLKILGKAVEQTRQDIIDLEAALPVSDFVTVQSIAHRLKGDYGNMRVGCLSDLARRLNDLAKTSQDKESAVGILTEFKSRFQQLVEAIDTA